IVIRDSVTKRIVRRNIRSRRERRPSRHCTQLDVYDVVKHSASIRKARDVSTEQTKTARTRRRGNRNVEAQHLVWLSIRQESREVWTSNIVNRNYSSEYGNQIVSRPLRNGNTTHRTQ